MKQTRNKETHSYNTSLETIPQFLTIVKLTRTYVNGTDIYPHMPILHLNAARYIANVFKFHERRISSVTFMLAHLYGNVYMRVCVALVLADSSDFGPLGEQSSQKLLFHPLNVNEPPCN